MKNPDEFYIGWEPQAPASIARTIKTMVVLLGLFAFSIGLLLAASQTTIARSIFEWGKVKEFSGAFYSRPYPHLVSGTNTLYLVAPFKHGIAPEIAAQFHQQNVTLKGTLIYRDNQRMIEVVADSIRRESGPAGPIPSTPLGRQTLIGEIVDSKCYFGVMNPGQFIPHRACAIRCISGGVPPVLVVRQKDGTSACLFLTSKDGRPLRTEILRLIAEPVRVTGVVHQDGHLQSIRAEKIERVRGS